MITPTARPSAESDELQTCHEGALFLNFLQQKYGGEGAGYSGPCITLITNGVPVSWA